MTDDDIIYGEFAGLRYADVPWPTERPWYGRGDRTAARGVILMGPDVRYTVPELLAEQNRSALLHSHIGFEIPGVEEAFPNRRIAMYGRSFKDLDFLTGWFAGQVPFPAGCDIRLREARHGYELVARTERKGSVVDVARKIAPEESLIDSLRSILGYFERNCPAARIGDGRTASPMLNAILRDLTVQGATSLRSWIDGPKIGTRRTDKHVIPEAQIVGDHGITRITLTKSDRSNAILTSVEWAAGHQIDEDHLGATVRINAVVPETVATALKGEPLSRLVDAPWTKGFVIRTAKSRTAAIEVRATSTAEPLVVPEGRQMRPADAVATFDALVDMRWYTVSPLARMALSRMDPDQIATAIAELLASPTGHLDLTTYGQPGWKLSGRGRISAEGPDESLADVLAAIVPGYVPRKPED